MSVRAKAMGAWRGHARAATTMVVAISISAAIAATASGITAHPHDQGKVQYPNPLPVPFTPHTGGANDANHSHLGGVAVKEVNPSAFGGLGPHMVDMAATPAWNTYSTWDNRVYRNGDTAAVVAYGHGYIDPAAGNQPRYNFGAGIVGLGAATLAEIQARTLTSWQTWQSTAKAQGEGSRTTPDGTALRTDLAFQDVHAAGGAIEFTINLAPTAAGSFGGWSPGAVSMSFSSNPQVQVFLNNPAMPMDFNNPHPDWEVSSDGLALGNVAKVYGALTPNITLPYNFAAGAPAALAQDIDYMCVKAGGCGAGVGQGSEWEGSEAAFTALALQVSDSAGGAAAPATTTPLFQADFLSLSIHEWGHAIGLDHSPAGVMFAQSPFTLGVTSRTIDVNNAIGAALLYSIPVPEPQSIALLVVGFVAAISRCPRRKGL